jgi:TATA-binding protein-associated factor
MIFNGSIKSLQQDFNLVYQSSRKSSGLPWDHPEPIPGASKNLERTLYNQRYLSVTFDEAQGVRNCGPKHSAALLILEQSVVRLILTATPLQTSTKVSSSALLWPINSDG